MLSPTALITAFSFPGRIFSGVERAYLQVASRFFNSLANSRLGHDYIPSPINQRIRILSNILGNEAFLLSQEESNLSRDVKLWCYEKKGTPEYENRQVAAIRILNVYNRNGQTLDLARLGLSSLPKSLGTLSQLMHLQLTGNQLKSVPPELANLSRLTILALRGNQLQSVPEEFAQLSSLCLIYLEDNNLSAEAVRTFQEAIIKRRSARLAQGPQAQFYHSTYFANFAKNKNYSENSNKSQAQDWNNYLEGITNDLLNENTTQAGSGHFGQFLGKIKGRVSAEALLDLRNTTVSRQTLKDAYKKLSVHVHPDKNKENEAVAKILFQALSGAVSYLENKYKIKREF